MTTDKKMQGFFHYEINHDLWTFYVVGDDDGVIIDEDSEAETDTETKEIHLKQSSVNLKNILHELWHVHTDYCFINTANLDAESMEEVSAELFSNRGDLILKQAREILEKLETIKRQGSLDEEQQGKRT